MHSFSVEGEPGARIESAYRVGAHHSARYILDMSFDHRHFNGYIIVDCRTSKYTLIPYVTHNRHRVPVSPHGSQAPAYIPLPRNRLTVNRSSRIKIISLSASEPWCPSDNETGFLMNARLLK